LDGEEEEDSLESRREASTKTPVSTVPCLGFPLPHSACFIERDSLDQRRDGRFCAEVPIVVSFTLSAGRLWTTVTWVGARRESTKI
jgi:hypothetical protein